MSINIDLNIRMWRDDKLKVLPHEKSGLDKEVLNNIIKEVLTSFFSIIYSSLRQTEIKKWSHNLDF